MPSMAGKRFRAIPGERWRPIARRPVYEVSSLGRVRRGGRLLSLSPANGYPTFMLYFGPVLRVYVHREVLIAFRGDPPTPLHECGHRDGNRKNCRLRNLRWITTSQNRDDARRHGTLARGGNCGPKGHRMSPPIVRRIRKLRARGWIQRRISAAVGFGQTHISKVLSGEIWSWVK